MERRTAQKNQFDGCLIFGAKNFNKKTGRNVHIDTSVKLQSDYFINPKTGLLYEHMAEKRNCPLCKTKKYHPLFIKDGFRHVKCATCNFIYVNPTASDKYRTHFFSHIYKTWTQVLLTPEQELVDRRKFKYGLKFIEKYIYKKGSLVDIGAGSGLFLKIARDSGWMVSAVEFNIKAVKNIERLGIEVFNQPLEKGIYTRDSIDIVTLWEVLEHINYPSIFLQHILKILRPRGLLFICVPNIDALVTRILHEKSRTFGGSSHVNFFSIDTLSKLTKKNGFEVLDTDTVISELETIRNYLSYENPYSGSANRGLDFLTTDLIYTNNLGSRILMLCRKMRS